MIWPKFVSPALPASLFSFPDCKTQTIRLMPVLGAFQAVLPSLPLFWPCSCYKNSLNKILFHFLTGKYTSFKIQFKDYFNSKLFLSSPPCSLVYIYQVFTQVFPHSDLLHNVFTMNHTISFVCLYTFISLNFW